MKTPPSPTSRSAQADDPGADAPRPKRRQIVAGAGVAAGAALVAAALGQRGEAPATVVAAERPAAPGEGYRLTDHVLRYYETTRS